MSDREEQLLALDRQIRDRESRTAEDLATIRVLSEQWASYAHVMRVHSERFEEAGVRLDAKNYFVQKGLAASRELDAYVSRLAGDHAELLDETERSLRSASEAELERLRREKADVSWG
ncbi:hypothetical protein [Leifsonia shinshuensis]|uniref:Putative membrane-anchored protein n=1 Tax=Leifsonia shinshuensis TaxID=150026 RepID=A0A853CUU3_9MICO|nr:hypothetical protein [Leifsonia shinshuensis]NYJ23201.1 putative membrane-anchored protein [Leifsonia shinshuensis]